MDQKLDGGKLRGGRGAAQYSFPALKATRSLCQLPGWPRWTLPSGCPHPLAPTPASVLELQPYGARSRLWGQSPRPHRALGLNCSPSTPRLLGDIPSTAGQGSRIPDPTHSMPGGPTGVITTDVPRQHPRLRGEPLEGRGDGSTISLVPKRPSPLILTPNLKVQDPPSEQNHLGPSHPAQCHQAKGPHNQPHSGPQTCQARGPNKQSWETLLKQSLVRVEADRLLETRRLPICFRALPP